MTQSLNDESRKHIEQVAGEALAQLESIAETAKSKLHDGRTLGSDALASINTMTSSSAIQRLDQISQANRVSYQVLVTEPAIARVVVVDEEGEEKNAEQDTINDDLLIDKGKPIIIDRQIITESGKILLKD